MTWTIMAGVFLITGFLYRQVTTNTFQKTNEIILKLRGMPAFILHILPAMKSIGKQDGNHLMERKAAPWCAIRKDYWVMVVRMKGPAVANVMDHHQNGQGCGGPAETLM